MSLFCFNIKSIYQFKCKIHILIIKIKNKYCAKVTLNLSSNVIGNSNDKTNFPHKFLLTDRQDFRLRKAFVNNSSANI